MVTLIIRPASSLLSAIPLFVELMHKLFKMISAEEVYAFLLGEEGIKLDGEAKMVLKLCTKPIELAPGVVVGRM